MEKILMDPKYLMMLLAGGVCYWIASGATRADYKAFHVVLGTAWFAGIWLMIYHIALPLCLYPPLAFIIGLIPAVICAFVWRRFLSDRVFLILRKWHITYTPFGPSNTWDIIEHIHRTTFYYITIYLSDGTVIGSNPTDVVDYIKNMSDFPETNVPAQIITDPQGNVAVIATEIQEIGKERVKIKAIDSEENLLVTYIPAANIKRIVCHLGPS